MNLSHGVPKEVCCHCCCCCCCSYTLRIRAPRSWFHFPRMCEGNPFRHQCGHVSLAAALPRNVSAVSEGGGSSHQPPAPPPPQLSKTRPSPGCKACPGGGIVDTGRLGEVGRCAPGLRVGVMVHVGVRGSGCGSVWECVAGTGCGVLWVCRVSSNLVDAGCWMR